MVASYIPLPAARVPDNAMLDTSELSGAITNFKNAQARNAMAEYQVGRDKVQDARAAASAGREAERFAMQKEEYQREKQAALVKNLAGVAQLVDQDTDPASRQQKWQRVVASHPSLATNMQKYGVDPNDHVNGPKFLIAEARGYQDPMAARKAEAEIANTQAQTGYYNAQAQNKGEGKLVEVYDEATGQPRKVLMGADGTMRPVGGVRAPEKRDAGLSVIEKKQVFDSEDALPALDATVSALNRAKELNSKTFEGMASGIRGSIGTAFAPNSMAGGVVGQVLDRDASEATSEWGKVMNMEAIQSMAATLKGATTNFELQEFVNILADPSTPPPIRARTIDRMLALAEGRRQTARRRIEELRSTGLRPSNGAPAPREQTNPQTGEPANPNVIDLGDGFSVEFGQ